MTVKIPVVDLKGKSKRDLDAPSEWFAIEPNESAVHFVCEGQRFRFYKKTVSTKTRSGVSGGGKKARKQKGTGSGRQGGDTATHWVGGGVTFGPKPIKREYKVNKKLYKIALASVLSDRHSGGQVRVLDASDLPDPNTKSLNSFLENLSLKGARVGFVVARKGDEALAKSVRNIRKVDVLPEEKWTTLDFVKTDSLIFSHEAFQGLMKKLSSDGKGGSAA